MICGTGQSGDRFASTHAGRVKARAETYAVAHLLEELDLLGLERSHGDGFDMVLELATVLCDRGPERRGSMKKKISKIKSLFRSEASQLTTAGEAEGESSERDIHVREVTY